VHVVVVEPRLTHGDGFRRGEQIADALPGVLGPATRFVGMHSCRCRASVGAPGERDRTLTAGQRLTDHHHVADSRRLRVGEHGVAIGVERGIAEVAVRVD
jgi:hypothetical protein